MIAKRSINGLVKKRALFYYVVYASSSKVITSLANDFSSANNFLPFELSNEINSSVKSGIAFRNFCSRVSMPLVQSSVLDPKNWTVPIGVELKTRNEVQDAKETKEL